MLKCLLKSKRFLAILLAFGVMFGLSIQSVNVFAVTEEQAMNNLTTYVYGQLSQRDYSLKEGGSIKGADLFSGDPMNGYDLLEGEFSKLSSSAQSQLVSDMAELGNKAVDDTTVNGVEDSTVETWWKHLQTKNGVGSKFMNEILKDTKPDFMTASRIYQPFSGFVGTVMGLIAILIMSLLGIVIVSDLAYIVIPPVRLFADSNYSNHRDKGSKSLIFSYAAMHSVEVAENGGSDGKENKHALGIYFKMRVIELIILGICLMYLVNGQIYTLVGYILDLVSGFLGF